MHVLADEEDVYGLQIKGIEVWHSVGAFSTGMHTCIELKTQSVRYLASSDRCGNASLP